MSYLRCDYCGWRPDSILRNAGDRCPKCNQGVLCAKGTKGNP